MLKFETPIVIATNGIVENVRTSLRHFLSFSIFPKINQF